MGKYIGRYCELKFVPTKKMTSKLLVFQKMCFIKKPIIFFRIIGAPHVVKPKPIYAKSDAIFTVFTPGVLWTSAKRLTPAKDAFQGSGLVARLVGNNVLMTLHQQKPVTATMRFKSRTFRNPKTNTVSPRKSIHFVGNYIANLWELKNK